MATPKTILFLGATGGCGLAALRKSLAAGHTCIALCRTPSKLATKLLPPSSPSGNALDEEQMMGQLRQQFPNLHVEAGNAHDAAAVARCLTPSSSGRRAVDTVLFSIGGAFSMSNMGIDDPHVCQSGMTALLSAVAEVRKTQDQWQPRVIAVSSTGVTPLGRDMALLFVPLYRVMLRVPLADKRLMEKALVASGRDGGVRFTIVRPSILTDGGESHAVIRAGVEDPVTGKAESTAVGYTISRDDVGRWIFENLIEEKDGQWVGKAATITY